MRTGGVTASRRGRAGGLLPLALACVLLGAAGLSSGCYAPQLVLLKSGLDSLRTQVDTMQVRDAAAARVLEDTRRDLAQQRDVLLATRASTSSTSQELIDQMGRLEGKLDEAVHFFNTRSKRGDAPLVMPNTPPTAPAELVGVHMEGRADTVLMVKPGTVYKGVGLHFGSRDTAAVPAVVPPSQPLVAGPDPVQLYDQATSDLTQGRYPLALQGYREFLRRFPSAELADNAQYGAGECFFAEAAFDSAAVEYAKLPVQYPKGDRVPAALYKLALCQERLGRAADSRRTLEELVRNHPSASESQLARDRLATARK